MGNFWLTPFFLIDRVNAFTTNWKPVRGDQLLGIGNKGASPVEKGRKIAGIIPFILFFALFFSFLPINRTVIIRDC